MGDLLYWLIRTLWKEYILNNMPKYQNQGSTRAHAKEEARRPNKGSIYISDPSPTGATRNFVGDFRDLLERTGISTIEIVTNDVKTHSNEPEFRLILICNNYSRIKADIEQSLSFLTSDQYSRIVLLVLHVGNFKSSSFYVDQDKKYSRLLGVIHMEYDNLTGYDILSCNRNREALENLKRLLPSATMNNDSSFRCIIF